METQNKNYAQAPNDVNYSTYMLKLYYGINDQNTFYSNKIGFKENLNKSKNLLSMLERFILEKDCFSFKKLRPENYKIAEYIEVHTNSGDVQYKLIFRIYSPKIRGEWIQIIDKSMKDSQLILSIRDLLFSVKTGKRLIKSLNISRLLVFTKMTKTEFEIHYSNLIAKYGDNNTELLKYKIQYMETFPEVFLKSMSNEIINPKEMWEKVNILFEQEIGPSEFNSNLRGKITFHVYQKETNSILLYFISNEFAKIFREKYSENFKRILINVFGNIQIKTAIVK